MDKFFWRTEGEAKWYSDWHNHPGSNLVHWTAFLLVATIMTWNTSTIIAQTNQGEYDFAEDSESFENNFLGKSPKFVPGQYIVVFKDDVKQEDVPSMARTLVNQNGGQIKYAYENVLKGFAVENLPEKAITALARNPNVQYIEQDQVIQIDLTQGGVVWGVDRLDQRALPLDSNYSYNYTGAGVTAYIFDTGIRYDHSEFEGRASLAHDVFGGDGSDCNGHGTHVAGTVGGKTYGVAKNVKLASVRVADCSGGAYESSLISAMDWVARNKKGPSVANISIGGGYSTSFNSAVGKLSNSGVSVSVSAGNNATDACTVSPGSAPAAITVGATDESDGRAGYSNYGTCVDVYAPGNSILSAGYGSQSGGAYLSGTSMASPHSAGVAALFLEKYPSATAQQVHDGVKLWSTKGIVAGANNINNHLLYSLEDGAAPPVADDVPPSSPANLVANVPGATTVSLSWSPSTDNVSVAGYRVYRDNIQIGTSVGTTYTDSVLSNSTYSYYVRAHDASGNLSSSSNSVSVSTPVAPFDVVSYSVTNITSTSAVVSWTTNYPSTGTVSYSISAGGRTRTAPTVHQVSDTNTSTSHSVVLTNLNKKTLYGWKIDSTRSATGETSSVSGSFKTKPN